MSQSLLPAAWRVCAALPDSSDSSQAVTTLGFKPVSAESVDANCCWLGVSAVLAVAGRVAPDEGATPPVSRLSVEAAGVSVEAVDAVGVSVDAVGLPDASALSATDPKLDPAPLGTALASAALAGSVLVAGSGLLVGSLVWACASAFAKLVDPVSAACVEPVLEAELLPLLMPSSESSSDPLDNDWSCCSIAVIRVRASEMLPILIRGSVQ